MQISLEQVVFHGWLCRLIGARRVLEIGTYLGLSGAAFALAMGEVGHVDTVEIDAEHADIAEGWFRTGGIADRISVHRGPATSVVPRAQGPLRPLLPRRPQGRQCSAPLELCAQRTRAGGLVMVDNVFSAGRVSDLDSAEGGHARPRWTGRAAARSSDPVVLPVADGILICRRV